MILTEISRRQAFLTHFGVSSIIFLVLSYLIIFHWYPDFYFMLDGGQRAIATVFFVDVVLGPGLTLLVFKPGKKSLKFDMSAIVLVQLSALIWGVHNVYTERSATTVFYQGKFTCISQSDAGEVDLPTISAGPSGKQNLALLKRPDTVDELLEFTKEAFAHKSSAVYYYGEKFVPLDEAVVSRMDKYQLDMAALREENAQFADTVGSDDMIQKDDERYQLIPLSCRYAKMIAVYDRQELRIASMLDVPTLLSAEASDEPLPLKMELQRNVVHQIQDDMMRAFLGE
ncbi:MAG: hypothetical protein KJO91_08615 [Gammaproteobacteria bacterium]|nr:hypothetical protein [Gammaproteobacteria bacterium]